MPHICIVSIYDLQISVRLGLEIRVIEMMYTYETIFSPRGIGSAGWVNGDANQGNSPFSAFTRI